MTDHPLINAYHAVFDQKDKEARGSDKFVAAAAALHAIRVVMANAGVPVPRRYDAPR